jgi:cell division protein FtsW
MAALTRADTSLLGRWWWTVDRWTLAALATLAGFGMLLVLAGSPAVALRTGSDMYFFVRKQVVFLPVALLLCIGASLLPLRTLKLVAVCGFLAAAALTAFTLVGGVEIKGARRWISLPGGTLQPSEILKPSFSIVTAMLLAQARATPGFPGTPIALGLLGCVVGLLKLQPDIGMAAIVMATFFAQWFVAGLRLYWVVLALGGIVGAGVATYSFFPHVQSRVQRFLDPSSGDNYQITVALEAFANGGLFGRGPGEGRVKTILPDAHADFVFAVAGEEFGLVLCLLLVALFAFVVLRGFARLSSENDQFAVLAGTGILTQFGLQALVNMASTLNMIPTKGMTLPFISYGGSSVLALGLGMGFLLALTRRRSHGETARGQA